MAEDIAFFLPGRPHGGGVNSVVQEFAGLVEHYGVGRLLVNDRFLHEFRSGYGLSSEALSRVTVDPADIPDGLAIVATTNDSLDRVRADFTGRCARIYYYVQDYEPLFYMRHTKAYEVAAASYANVSDVVAVVKTGWLLKTLLEQTFLPVVRIRPSIDRSLYRPAQSQRTQRRLVAMVRPATSRRGTSRTVAVLNRVAESSLDLRIDVFGTSSKGLSEAGVRLHPSIVNHGRLSARQAGELVCSGDLMLDLSDYQAFGRTAAEGMAAGVLPVITNKGAPPEFVTHGVNGALVAPGDLDAAYDAIAEVALASDDLLRARRLAAMDAVADWSVEATTSDWFALMRDA